MEDEEGRVCDEEQKEKDEIAILLKIPKPLETQPERGRFG